jgi:hypothetical protein
LPAATRFAHFLVAGAGNGVSLDFAETTGAITPQHYAFLINEEEWTHNVPDPGSTTNWLDGEEAAQARWLALQPSRGSDTRASHG